MGRKAVRISRAMVLVLFIGILWMVLDVGALRYHLLASPQAVSLAGSELPQANRFVELKAVLDLRHGVRGGKGPFRFALIPVEDRRDVWLLFVGSLSRVFPTRPAVFHGRLVRLRRVPFLRHLAGRKFGLSSQTWVVEVGHVPRRILAWFFFGVFSVAFAAAQFLITLVAKVLSA